jgi:hypothetical protein
VAFDGDGHSDVATVNYQSPNQISVSRDFDVNPKGYSEDQKHGNDVSGLGGAA